MGIIVLATFLLTVIAVIVGLLCVLIAAIGVVYGNALWLIIGFVALLFSGVIAMTILSNNLGDFNIIGFWPKVLLSFMMFLFELSSPNRD